MFSLSKGYKGKRVVVTGHTGFKGRWLSHVLTQFGAEVVGFSKDAPLSHAGSHDGDSTPGVMDLRGDIRNLEDISHAIGDARPDFIFHLAAQAIVSQGYSYPLETYSTNVLGTANVLECIRGLDHECSVVLITSDKVYRNNEWLWGYKETDDLGGYDPYSSSKAAAELVIQSFSQSFLVDKPARLAVARAGNVVGGGDWSRDRIVPDCARSWRADKPAVIRNPDAVRPWQHVLEPLRGYLMLGLHLADDRSLNGEAFNFGPRTEDCRTVGELVALLGEEWNGFQHLEDKTTSIGKESNLLKLNCEKASELLGWEPKLNFDQSIRMTAEWYARYFETYDQDAPMSDQILKYFADKDEF